MPDTLVVLAHPDLANSRVNAALSDAVRDLPDVTVHDLYAAYPDLRVDADHERELLLAHDRIVLQFPFHWYSSPALLKQWSDDVLAYGFAYGAGGTALHGKSLRVATTTGGSEELYHPSGLNRFPVADLLRPFDATANLVGMRYEDPFVVHGTRVLGDDELVELTFHYRNLLAGRVPVGVSA